MTIYFLHIPSYAKKKKRIKHFNFLSLSHSLSCAPSLFYFFLSPAEICINKSLLLFRFSPSGGAPVPHPDTESPKQTESINAAPLLRSVSISEGDFQPCPSPSTTQTSTGTEAVASAGSSHALRVQTQVSSASDPGASSSASTSAQGSRGSTESLHSQSGEPASPLAFSRKVPFSRGRLRLLSYRSVEETRTAPSVKERFPVLKHILSFMKDMVINETRYGHSQIAV